MVFPTRVAVESLSLVATWAEYFVTNGTGVIIMDTSATGVTVIGKLLTLSAQYAAV